MTRSAESRGINYGDICNFLDSLVAQDLSKAEVAKSAVHEVKRIVDQIRDLKLGLESNEKFTKLKKLSTDLVTIAKESASSIGMSDEDPELIDGTSDTDDYLNNEDENAGDDDKRETVDVSGVMSVSVIRRRTRSDAACAAAGPSPKATHRGPQVLFETPRSVASKLKEPESAARPGDCHLDRKFNLNLVGKKPMRQHPLGANQPCSGLVAEFCQCASLVYERDIPVDDKITEMCGLLEELIKGALLLYEIYTVVTPFTEDIFQEVHTRALRVLCAMLDPAFNVYDIRRRPYLVLKERDAYFTGYGDVLVTLMYTLKSGKEVEIAVCANELKKDALTVSNGLGQTAGQILHFNGRHSRRFKLESIVAQPLHFCSGVLTNPVSYVGLTVAKERGVALSDHALFVVELAEGKPLWCILTMLLRALELRTIVTGSGAVKAEPRELAMCEPPTDGGDGDSTGDPATDGGDAGLGDDSPPPKRDSNLGGTEPGNDPDLDGPKGKSRPTPPSDNVPGDSDDESACWSDLDDMLGTADDVLEIKALPPPLVLRFSGQTAVARFVASLNPC